MTASPRAAAGEMSDGCPCEGERHGSSDALRLGARQSSATTEEESAARKGLKLEDVAEHRHPVAPILRHKIEHLHLEEPRAESGSAAVGEGCSKGERHGSSHMLRLGEPRAVTTSIASGSISGLFQLHFGHFVPAGF